MLRSERNPQSDKKTKELKPKFASKDSLRKKALQNKTKNKQIARHRHRNTEREPELTHLFKNNSFDISLYREYLYTCRAGFIFIWGISVAHPVLVLFLCREFLLHIPCWLHFLTRECFLHIPSCLHFYVGLCLDFYVGNYLTHSVLALIWSEDFLLQIPCWFQFYRGNLSYTSRAVFIALWGVSFTDPKRASFLFGMFRLHITCWLHFYQGSFSYTSRAGFTFIWEASLTQPMLALHICGEFLLHSPCWLYISVGSFSYTSHSGFFDFNIGSFSYTSHTGFSFIWGFS